SMGSIGDCFDNAVVESLWARMQVELLDRRRWRTSVELANATFEQPGGLPQPPEEAQALGMRTPIKFERMHEHPRKWHEVKQIDSTKPGEHQRVHRVGSRPRCRREGS